METPDPHAFQPLRYRVWQRRQFPWRTVCRVGCGRDRNEHPEDE